MAAEPHLIWPQKTTNNLNPDIFYAIYGQSILNYIAMPYQIMPKYLFALASMESGWGQSIMATDDNQLWGFKMYNPITKSFKENKYFSSFDESNKYFAKFWGQRLSGPNDTIDQFVNKLNPNDPFNPTYSFLGTNYGGNTPQLQKQAVLNQYYTDWATWVAPD